MPPTATSFLDVGANCGWFARRFADLGFVAQGVDRDPYYCAVARAYHGLPENQVVQEDCATYLANRTIPSDIVSCLSVLHHYVLDPGRISPVEFVRLLDRATGKVLFLETGQVHEQWFERPLAAWTDAFIAEWIKKHTTFRDVVVLGRDEDNRAPFAGNFGRTLFACIR